MTTDPPEPKPRRKWHFYKWLFALPSAIFAHAVWRARGFRSALQQAKALGWQVAYTEPAKKIKEDWKAAFDKDTWADGVAHTLIPDDEQLGQHTKLLLLLNPQFLLVKNSPALRDLSEFKGLTNLNGLSIRHGSNLTNLDTLKDLKALTTLQFNDCIALTNLDPLKHLTALDKLDLEGCTALTNLDGLKTLSALKYLDLSGCKALTNLDALKPLNALKHLRIIVCKGLTNVDALKGLPSLKRVDLQRCTGLTEESIAELRKALPAATIFADQPYPPLAPWQLESQKKMFTEIREKLESHARRRSATNDESSPRL